MPSLSTEALPTLFLRHPDDTWLVGWGPVTRAALAPKDRPAFYLPDFFLKSQESWWVPEEMGRFNRAELENKWPQIFSEANSNKENIGDKSNWKWEPPAREKFQSEFNLLYDFAKQEPHRKAVAMTMISAPGTPSLDLFYRWWKASFQVPARRLAFGAWAANEGVIGMSPEILFLQERGRLQSMALAGTAPAESTTSLFESTKDCTEHQLVVDDIETKLLQLGEVAKTPTVEWVLGRVKHLRTNFSVRADATFEALVKLLHPTPALGVYPRDPELKLLRKSEYAESRGRFGAPFGVSWPGNLSYAIVSIRGLEWDVENLHLRAGCGIVAASEFEKEWAELQLKTKVIREQFEV